MAAGLSIGLTWLAGALDPGMVAAGREISRHAFGMGISELVWRGVLGGGIVASMVWLVHAVRDSAARVLIIRGLMLLIPTADLFHCITGSCEVIFGWLHDEVSLGQTFAFLPSRASSGWAGRHGRGVRIRGLAWRACLHRPTTS
jgi:formate/nitrite transporter FocA (FNT family)